MKVKHTVLKQLAGNPMTPCANEVKYGPGLWFAEHMATCSYKDSFILPHRSDYCVNCMCFSFVICVFGLQDVEGRENV